MFVRWRNGKETRGFLWVVVGRSSNGCSDGCGSGGLEVGFAGEERGCDRGLMMFSGRNIGGSGGFRWFEGRFRWL
ncbi:hypothetical protein H5410_046170 [Solanum commersonii]|uniref:Uncharacterized protein n=1 Tax=Solanum commersonii TaxID=4109 RepID=A0A9J5XFS7_SOLCO|nr:hypothetical protein H5410_046170 [Solanum commersonii]